MKTPKNISSTEDPQNLAGEHHGEDLYNSLSGTSMFSLYPKGIIIDSRFSSRKKIKRDLDELRLFKNTYEAESFDKGIQALRAEKWNACIIGPSLSIESVEQIAIAGRKKVKSLDCAFIAIIKDLSSEVENRLKDAGIHSVIGYNYSKKRFLDVTTFAISKAHRDPIVRDPSDLEIHDILADSAHRLRAIAQTAGKEESTLVEKEALPNVITEMICSTFEEMFPNTPTKDHEDVRFFSKALTEWISKRVSSSHFNATEELRKKLISNFYRQQSLDFARKTSNSLEVLNPKVS